MKQIRADWKPFRVFFMVGLNPGSQKSPEFFGSKQTEI